VAEGFPLLGSSLVELRLSTELATLTGVMRDVQVALRESHGVHDVIIDHERRLSVLESRQG
jgi:hypothetical protein